MTVLTSLLRRGAWAVVCVAAIATSACSLDKQTQPPLIGPSGLGKQVILTASPDQLPRDARSQSVITVELRDASGKGIPGAVVSVGATPGANVSQSQVTTGGDGKAQFAVVAPGPQDIIPNNTIVVGAVPVGANFDNAVAGTVSIALLGVSNSTAPTAAFTVTPLAPELNQIATFDASSSQDEGGKCANECSYAWNFDDGTTASGMIVTHSFSVARSYSVALTVTDATGLTSTLRQLVTPISPPAPTVVMSVSPAIPVVDQTAVFKAVGTPAPNHSIVKYDWDFGDGVKVSSTSATTTHTYTARGIYNAVVSVTDDIGQQGHDTKQFNLTSGVPSGINATFFVSPNPPGLGAVGQYNANESTPSNGATITNYHWIWGDGTPDDDTSNAIITHTFAAKGTYRVQLTITDSAGRTSQTRLDIPIS
jgi:PKD repeat protein